jgi:hypothetical protein
MRGLMTLQQPSLEAIQFQDTSYFKELTMLFASLKKYRFASSDLPSFEDDSADKEMSDMIAASVKKRMGLTIKLDFHNGPAVEIPHVNKNNPLINSFIQHWISSKDGLKMIKEAAAPVRGKVSLKDSSVSGVFSDVVSTLWFDYAMINSPKYEPEELAAIMLHELGHLFTYYEFMSRTVTTNQALAGLSKAWDESGSVDERESLLVTIKQSLKLTDIDEKDLAKSSNKKVVEMVIITSVARQSESELGSNIYDFSTWEYLADQFATRHGAGRYLVTGLDKLYRGFGHISFRSTAGYFSMEALKMTLFLFPAVVAVAAPAIFGPALYVGFFALILFGMDGAGDGTYDQPGARMKRIRNQIIENLKDKKLSKDDQNRLQEDLATIDALMKSVDDRRQLMGVLVDTISPGARRARKIELLHKELENIAANDLFLRASELTTLAK